MARAGRGSIVNVGSIYGLLSPDQSLYDFRRDGGRGRSSSPSPTRSRSPRSLNLTRYLATYWGASGVRVNTLTPHGIENGQPRGVRRGVRAALAARPADGRRRGGRRRRLPRLRRVVVRHRREPRRRRRLVGLVIPARDAEPRRGRGAAAATGEWLDKMRPATASRSAASRARAPTTPPRPSTPPARPSRRGPSARPSSAATSCARSRELLRERREEASELVAAETGKPLALALGETDAAVEMGLFVAGEGRRSYGRTTTGVDAAPDGADAARPVGVAGAHHLVQHAAAERRLEGVPVDPLRQRLGAEAVRAHAASPPGGSAGSASRPGCRRAS